MVSYSRKERIKCWDYNRADNSERLKRKCSIGVNSCIAHWKDLGNGDYFITKQGCNLKMKGCNKKHCQSVRNVENKHYFLTENNTYSYQLAHLNICCCRRNLCNSRLVSYNDNLKLHRLESAPNQTDIDCHNTPPTLELSPIVSFVFGVLGMLVVVIFLSIFKKGKFIPRQCRGLFYSSQLKSDITKLKDETCEREENIPFVDVDFSKPIGEGTFGNVYIAKSLQNIPDAAGCSSLCFKVSKSSNNVVYKNEINILSYLNEFDNDNIVKYYGEIYVSDKWGYLMEYCAQGSLKSYLQNNSVDLKMFLSMALDFTSGVSFLHNISRLDMDKSIVAHRDICSSNVLVRENLSLALADFGVALKVTEGEQFEEEVYKQGTPYYMAPEILCQSIDLHHTTTSLKQADVYSMSLVLWEICNMCSDFYGNPVNTPGHNIPYQREVPNSINDVILFNEALYNYVVVEKKRPCFEFTKVNQKAPNISTQNEILETISSCWESDEESRLTAACVEERFKQLKVLHG